MKISTLIKALLICLVTGISTDAYAIITVDSAVTTPSRCANDGTITVYVHTGTGLLYELVTGPDIRPAQSGNVFNALPIGTYQVMVTNFANDTTFINAMVGGTYTSPDFAPTWADPKCAGSATGRIIGNRNPNSGRPPYHWVLTNVNTGTAITQLSDSFLHVPAGTYTLRLYDSCQGFATRYITLNDPNTAFTVYVQNSMTGCDSDQMQIRIAPNYPGWAMPYTATVTTPTGSFTFTLNDTTVTPSVPAYYFQGLVTGAGIGDIASLTVVNGCGETVYHYNQIGVPNLQVYFPQVLDSCMIAYRPAFYLYGGDTAGNATYYYESLHVKIWDSTANTLVMDTPLSNTQMPILASNHLYSATLTDGCGVDLTISFASPALDTPYVTKYIYSGYSCRDSGAAILISGWNFTSQPTLRIIAGPSSVHSTKPYFSYYDTVIYPLYYTTPGCGGYTPPSVCYQVGGLAAGLYTYEMFDTCGHVVRDTFFIHPSDLTDFSYQRHIVKGCPGQNKIGFDLHYTTGFFYPGLMRIKIITAPYYTDSLMAVADTFENLNSGTYILDMKPSDFGYPYMLNLLTPSMMCTEFHDTIVIPPYQIPRVSYATQIKCNGTVNVALIPDSATGVAPYNYEILSGPQTAGLQASNFFQLTQPGIYIARISDTCGFGRTFTFSVDTLSFPQIVKVGVSCAGNNAILVAQHSAYATYHWELPGGGTYTGDTIRLSPVTAADYGVYHIQRVVSVNGCRDTFNAVYTLVSGGSAISSVKICTGYSYTFAGQTLSQSGTYYDTIHRPSCDSISELHLSVSSPPYDSVSLSICTGQSIIVGPHTYSSNGIYRDTFHTTYCDSVHVVNLTIGPRIDSVTRTICAGQSVASGPHTYTTTGLYRDTTITAGCDSIHILDLTVGSYKIGIVDTGICAGQLVVVTNNGFNHYYFATGVYRDTFATAGCDSIQILNLTVGVRTDSVSRSICIGQSITVGTHIYSTPGLYRDTFWTGSCDSVHILNLAVGLKKDSTSQSICTGQSITVGLHTYSTAGIYRDTFSTAGCDSVHILNLSVGSQRIDSASRSICTGQSITVGTHTYNTTGIYRDTFATATCDSIHILKLSVGGAIIDSVSQSICQGQSITVGPHSYSTAGIYRDTFATAACDSVHILDLRIGGMKRDTTSIGFCEGQSVSVGGHTYTQSGFYSDTIAANPCDSIHTTFINIWLSPSIQVTASDTVAMHGDTIQLIAIGDSHYHYTWSSNAVLNSIHDQNPQAILQQSTWAVVQASDTNNCVSADSIFIRIGDCEGLIFVPNAFTPNGDGINDTYHIAGRCITLHEMKIFNRWGEKVWETDDINASWDGTYRGAMQPTEVYVYLLSYTPSTSGGGVARHIQGSIALIR